MSLTCSASVSLLVFLTCWFPLHIFTKYAFIFCRVFVPVAFSEISEVEYAFSVDEDVVDKVVTTTDVALRECPTESESDWIEPALHLYNSKSFQAYGQENILDAVRLFQINQPFKVALGTPFTNYFFLWFLRTCSCLPSITIKFLFIERL